MNESELIQAARGGDEAAFEQLVRLHEKKIYNLCLRMCGSSEDAAEAAQDTFLALWRGLEGFRDDYEEHISTIDVWRACSCRYPAWRCAPRAWMCRAMLRWCARGGTQTPCA